MSRLRRIALVAVPIVVIVAGCAGYSLYWLHHERMYDKPVMVYRHYEDELQVYGRRLLEGDVRHVEGRGYGLPQYLIDHGARYCTKHGDCFCITFGFIADSLIPQLWFSPAGFDPMPADVTKRKGRYSTWEQLSPQWGAGYDP